MSQRGGACSYSFELEEVEMELNPSPIMSTSKFEMILKEE